MKLRAIVSTALACLLAVILPAAAHASAFGGDAYVAYANVPALGAGSVRVAATGQLDGGGGFRSAGSGAASIPGVMRGDVVASTTVGGGHVVRSSASANRLVLLPGTAFQVTAKSIRVEVSASCGCAPLGRASEITNLVVAGNAIGVTGALNQKVQIGALSLTINEVQVQRQFGFHQITLNALHLVVPNLGEIIVAHASAAIDCDLLAALPAGPCHDFISGSGEINTPLSTGSFALAAGRDPNGALQMRFNFIDRRTGIPVEAVGITSYTETSNTARRIQGAAKVNGQLGFTYTIDVDDVQDPGAGGDILRLTLSNGYAAGGTLNSGNLMLTVPCR